MSLATDIRAALIPVWQQIWAELGKYKILSGPGIPADTLGGNGNLYFDTTGKALYGPKAVGAWGSGVSLAGSAGADGKTVRRGSGAPFSNGGGRGGPPSRWIT